MNQNIINRDQVINALKRELVGPSPDGIEKELPMTFSKQEEAYGPFREMGTGEEIIQRDTPTKRYGVGVLHPIGVVDEEEQKELDAHGIGNGESLKDGVEFPEKARESLNQNKNIDKAQENISRITMDLNPDDLDLSITNSYKPSTIGVSFLAEFPGDAKLVVDATGGRYKKIEVDVEGTSRIWWLRSPVSLHAEIEGKDIITASYKKISPPIAAINLEGINLQVEVYTRPYHHSNIPNARLLTVCLVNRSAETAIENTLFQAHFKLSIIASDGQNHIFPYPGPELSRLDDEEKSMALLYHHEHTFGVGHGCAAMWDYMAKENRAAWLTAECLPFVETASITPDIHDDDGNEIKISMASLAGLVNGDDGYQALEKLVISYEKWISNKDKDVSSLEVGVLQETAKRHLADCRFCAERMRRGLDFLKTTPVAYRAFQLANRAILLQQIHSRSETRKIIYDENAKRYSFSDPYVEPDPMNIGVSRGSWRAFQIAFLLATIESVANSESIERDIVELIWFPTGGGKTEAYLGLAAFSLLLRRIKNPDDNGVHVLMRYTLRLLTTQQFIRASRLICALEHIRRQEKNELGSQQFSIGLWVGGNNTPNTREEALTVFKGLEKGQKHVENKFVLDRCPWCGAQLGPVEDEKLIKKGVFLIGYYQVGKSVAFRCSDTKCEFHASGLPIMVTDEEMYQKPPSMIIGTVDKFAMLTWKSEARALFGVDEDGKRVRTPPGLIVQDELHLISGPLGSLVGLYETLIEELCTDRRTEKSVKPKIISSTATIRRYKEQIQALYARTQANLFPPPGIDVGDSFFSKYATAPDGSLLAGKIYLGIHAPGLGSMQIVQMRTFSALLQAPMEFQENERDPWWTLLMFFNSLRELGTTLSLLQSSIPDYQRIYANRYAGKQRSLRFFSESGVVELTGRASSQEIPKAIAALEKSYLEQSQQKPIDVCLASNILEVGIDIERLSLMAVVGQPKTTSQYIQVTGRVGRNWKERPGLIVTLYSASKPRDRSHFEKFVSYHQKLYSQVEPTSVTPFSAPVLERALHALMIAYIKQTASDNVTQSPEPFPEKIIEKLKDIILARVKIVDPDEVSTFESIFAKRAAEWKTNKPILWESELGNHDDIPLMKVAGTFFERTSNRLPWPTMQSMRSVDAGCIAEIAEPPSVEEDGKYA